MPHFDTNVFMYISVYIYIYADFITILLEWCVRGEYTDLAADISPQQSTTLEYNAGRPWWWKYKFGQGNYWINYIFTILHFRLRVLHQNTL